MISLIQLLEEINSPKIYSTIHKGGILLWVITDNKSKYLEDLLKLETKELRNKLNQNLKIKNLINPLQLYLNSYRPIKGQDKFILDNSIATKKDLNLTQINLIQQYIENEGFEIKNIFKNY